MGGTGGGDCSRRGWSLDGWGKGRAWFQDDIGEVEGCRGGGCEHDYVGLCPSYAEAARRTMMKT